MTAMIDVVFLLLVFFLWTTSFEKPEGELAGAIALSGGGTASDTESLPTEPLEPFDDLIITLLPATGDTPANQQTPQIRLNDQPVTLDSLRERLQRVVNLGIQPPVVIAPEPGVNIGAAIKVYDLAKLAGLTRVMMAVRSE